MDIKDIALQSAETGIYLDFTNINCGKHKNQKCCMYCKECEEIVCEMCISEVHDDTHNMIEIHEGYQVSLSQIKTRNSQVEGEIMKLTSDVSKLDSVRSAQRSHVMTEKEKILNHEKALKTAVEQHTKKLLNDLDKNWKDQESKMEDEETYASKMIKDLEIENEGLTKVMDSNNASEVLNTALEKSNLKRLSPAPVKTKYPRLPQFVPREITPLLVESIYGILEEEQQQKIQQSVDIRLMKQYVTVCPVIDTLTCRADGSLWISDTNNSKIHNLKLSDGSIHVNKAINLFCADMAFTSSGDLLLSTGSNSLSVIPHLTWGVKESNFSVSPLMTTAVHVSADNKIIVGAKEDGPAFLVRRLRLVVVMDMKGRHEQVHKCDKKMFFFTYPYRITTDKEKNIYVIDILSIDNARVVVLGHGGDLRGIYTGQYHINDVYHPFNPGDIVTTRSDNVIVSDPRANTLHILNNNAQCVQYLNTEHLGIVRPYSLCIDNRGVLFVGCHAGCGKSDAKIHEVQLVKSTEEL